MRRPDLTGPGVQAWRLPREPIRTPAHAASLSAWVVKGPFHPAWSEWLLAVVHLRPIPGSPKPHRSYPEAEFELMIVSLNPDRPFDPDAFDATGDWGDPSVSKFLSPPDLVHQFHGVPDRVASDILDGMVHLIVRGEASPDSDSRSWWKSRIDESVAAHRTLHQEAPHG